MKAAISVLPLITDRIDARSYFKGGQDAVSL